MPRVAFPITTFTESNGSPLSDGYLEIRLNTDARTPDPGQLGAQASIRVSLDGNGIITGSPTFWANSVLQPNDTVYLLSVFTSLGQPVLQDQPVVVI